MDAARLHQHTHEMANAFVIEEVERPNVVRSNHVLIEITGAGWCQTDNHIVEGMWTEYVDHGLPLILGHENAGKVVETGDEVTSVTEGDSVICHPNQTCGICRPCRLGEDMYCENNSFNGMTTDGGFAEYMLTSERALIRLPDGVDSIDVAPHADAGITAYHAAKKAVQKLNPGDTAVVIGVGGLGHIGVQCLDVMSSAEIIAIDLKDEALDLAGKLGADYTINSAKEDVSSLVADMTDDAGAEQILDFVGVDETTSTAADIAAIGGDCHVVGYGGHVTEPCQHIVTREFSYKGSKVGRYTELQELITLVDRGDITLHTERYSLDEINTVAERLEQGEIEGRAVITP